MENGAFEKKWEVFFFLVVLFLVSFILIRAGLQRIREASPLDDHQSLLARMVEDKTFLRNNALPLKAEEADEDAVNQDEQINEEVIRQFNERAYTVSERIAKSVVGSSDASKSELVSDIVVFPESMRLPPVKDKEMAQLLLAERANNALPGSNRSSSSDVANSSRQPVAVAIPFAQEWKERQMAEESNSVTSSTSEPESYSVLHSEDMSAQVPAVKVAAKREKTETGSKPSVVVTHKAESTTKPNPFRNVSLENDVAPAAKTEPAKPATPSVTQSVTKTDKAAQPIQTEPQVKKEAKPPLVQQQVASKPQTTAQPVKTKTVSVATSKEATKTTPAQKSEVQSKIVVDATPAVNEPNNAKAANQLCDEVWLVSNPCCQSVSPGSLAWCRLEGCQFVSSTYDAYQANDATVPTLVFIHGNLTDMSSAVESGMYLKCRLEAIRKCLGIQSAFRLVIWKWNSEKAFAGIRKDSQYKAAVADEDGRSLAEFLRNDKASRTTLLGFSFGAKIIGSACNILAKAEHKAYNAIFVSAATDYYDFAPCGCYSSGAVCLERLLNLYNPEDKALRFYPLLYGRRGAPALGTMPLTTEMVSPCLQGKTLSLSSVCCGNQHKFAAFMQCIPDQTLAEIVFSHEVQSK